MEAIGGRGKDRHGIVLRHAPAGVAVLIDLDAVLAHIDQHQRRAILEHLDDLAAHAFIPNLLSDHAAQLLKSDDDTGHGEANPWKRIMESVLHDGASGPQ